MFMYTPQVMREAHALFFICTVLVYFLKWIVFLFNFENTTRRVIFGIHVNHVFVLLVKCKCIDIFFWLQQTLNCFIPSLSVFRIRILTWRISLYFVRIKKRITKKKQHYEIKLQNWKISNLVKILTTAFVSFNSRSSFSTNINGKNSCGDKILWNNRRIKSIKKWYMYIRAEGRINRSKFHSPVNFLIS